MNLWVAVYRICWVALVVLAVVGLTCVFVPRFNSYQTLQNEKVRKENENRLTAKQIDGLKQNQASFQTDAGFVEHSARQQGMVMTGETVYKPVPISHAQPVSATP